MVPQVEERAAEATNGETSRSSSRNSDDQDPILDAVENAVKGDKVIVLYVYTASEDRKFARAKAACEVFEKAVFGNYAIATELQQGYTCVRVDLASLDRKVRSQYNISNNAPQMLIFDSTGRKLASIKASNDANAVINMLKAAKEHNEKVVAKAKAD